jgi:hypothetical protein
MVDEVAYGRLFALAVQGNSGFSPNAKSSSMSSQQYVKLNITQCVRVSNKIPNSPTRRRTRPQSHPTIKSLYHTSATRGSIPPSHGDDIRFTKIPCSRAFPSIVSYPACVIDPN